MKLKANYQAVYIVANMCGPYFMDMFRYDRCCPATETDANRLEACAQGDAQEWIVLMRFVPKGGSPHPTVARWKSFGVDCHPVAYADYYDAQTLRDTLNKYNVDTSPRPCSASFISTNR